MEQVVPFDQSKAGAVKYMCLNNVRLGYGIPNKYATATQAWEHTQQHPDRNVPSGVDVPLYYSYTTTIDGVTANYGHINVRLANGKVWSDGVAYASLDAYLQYHLPKYLGWGESVNDVRVIKEGDTVPEDYKVNQGDVTNVCNSYGWTPDQNYLNVWVGQPWKKFWYDVSSQPNTLNTKSKAEKQVAQIKVIVEE